MHVRFPHLSRWRPGRLSSRIRIAVIGVTLGFVAMVTLSLQPSAPEGRLPGAYRLAALIQRQQQQNDDTRLEVQRLQAELLQTRLELATQQDGIAAQNNDLAAANAIAGVLATSGQGFEITLDDSSLESAPTGNVNDLVIHSQDVQAVVNALWQTGATAISVNGQRLVSTSAVLCVGNTLLLNGTVHAPPYEVSAIGADRDRFQADSLVQRLRSDADRFSLRFSIGKTESIDVPAYTGVVDAKYALPIG